jgi:thiol-disulfide isomerase/thioredoxin
METVRNQMSIINRITVVLLFGIAGCNGMGKAKPVSTTEADRPIDKIRLRGLDEKTIDLQKYKGKTIVINFWATWCKPCIIEMPSIEKAQNILRDKKIVFLLASGETGDQIEDFKHNHDYQFTYARIENSEALNIQALPSTFIFNSKGDLIFSEMGARNWADSSNINMILKIARQND